MEFELQGNNSNSRNKRKECVFRGLLLLNVFCIVALILAITVIFRFASIIQENKATNVCHTAGCAQTAATVLESLDTSVDPCHDFYDFACGKFINNTYISDEKVSIDTFTTVRDKTQAQIVRLIDDDIDPDELRSFQLAKELYKTCMNRTRIEEQGLHGFIDTQKALGGWPCIEGDKWNADETWSWTETIQKFATRGFSFSYIVLMSIDVDMRNSTRRRIVFDDPSLGLSREYLVRGLNDTVVKAYYDYMVDMAVLFGAKREVAKEELYQSLQFEISLANISLPMEQRRNSTELYNPMTLAEMQSKYPYNQWVQYVNRLLPNEVQVDSEEVVVVNSPGFLDGLTSLLERTSHRTIANYLIWRITDYAVYYLNNQVRKRQLDFSTVTVGKKEFSVRWKECISMVNNKLPISVGALYIRQYFKPEAKQAATEMVEHIRQEFKDALQKNEWMDVDTKKAALSKVDAIISHIAYPDELYDDQKLETFYEKMVIDPDNYLESVLKINQFYNDYAFNQLRKPVNKTDWVQHAAPTYINAFYSFEENSIELPAGILQGIFFGADRPRYMNFGGIGFIIGHEITHGFDDEGRQYDLNGNLVDWWNNVTEKHFLDRAKCIIDQYSGFVEEMTDLNVNGINTQGENIADNGGLKQSYNAYVKWTKENGPEPRLPGLQQYSPEQMFWIAAAQTWCAVDRPEYMTLRITNGVHAPDKFRVIGSVTNLEQFAKDFNCPADARMNPKQKCTVW